MQAAAANMMNMMKAGKMPAMPGMNPALMQTMMAKHTGRLALASRLTAAPGPKSTRMARRSTQSTLKMNGGTNPGTIMFLTGKLPR